MAKTDCLFCKIARREIPAKIVHETDLLLAFEDIRPQAPVHIIIIPKSHIEKLSDIGEKDKFLMGSLMLAAKEVAKEKGVQESGYRVVINCNKDAGQVIFHIHLHLLGGRAMNWPPG